MLIRWEWKNRETKSNTLYLDNFLCNLCNTHTCARTYLLGTKLWPKNANKFWNYLMSFFNTILCKLCALPSRAVDLMSIPVIYPNSFIFRAQYIISICAQTTIFSNKFRFLVILISISLLLVDLSKQFWNVLLNNIWKEIDEIGLKYLQKHNLNRNIKLTLL